MAGRFRVPLIVASLLLAGGVAIVLVCAGLMERKPDLTEADILLARAKKALDRRDFPNAETLARAALDRGTTIQGAAWIVAGEATVQQRRFEEAVECFLNVVKVGGRDDEMAMAHSLAGDVLARRLYRLADAEKHYRLAFKLDPKNDNARRGLVTLLVAEGRRGAAEEILMSVVKDNKHTDQHLYLLGNSEWVIKSLSFKTREGGTQVKRDEFLDLARKAVPDDPIPTIGLARLAEIRNQTDLAIELLEKVVKKDPEQIEAQAMLGLLLAHSGDARRFLDWNKSVPESANQDARTWFARATWAAHVDQEQVATRCLWECLKRDPNHLAANLQLAQSLDRLGRPIESTQFRQRAQQLSELVTLLRGLAGNPRYGGEEIEPRVRRLVELNRKLGRVWEAVAWSMFALRKDQELKWPKKHLEDLRPYIEKRDTPRTIEKFTPLATIDLSDLPAPDWANDAASQAADGKPQQTKVGPIAFRNDARAAGLDFLYYSDRSFETETSRLPETIGGGAGVLDFDGDGWPDLYLAQGSHKRVDPGYTTTRPPVTPPRVPPTDRLFRNTADGRFQDITLQAKLNQTDYGQGVTTGDVNGDGFADIHVANVGSNTLLINNGDGTYSDETRTAGVGGDEWSVSSVLADLNGDGLADLYVVNYLSGQDLFMLSCPPNAPVARACGPGDFSAAQDRLFLNTGDGRFRDATDSSGVTQAEGKGLGAIVADFDGTGRLDLFIANDTRPNFLFRNQPAQADGGLTLVENALRSGVAYSDSGLPQDCMGIAVGDVDGDGTLDLFVTNYIGQSNTLYSLRRPRNQRTGAGLFLDKTRSAGLFDDGFSLVGWGTEFLDADLDGDLDLMITNGHVAGQVREGEQLKMPPLCYRNTGTGRFTTLAGKQLGQYFTRNYIGRGLARLDWNNDGRPDTVITHLDSPLALLTNTTPNTGHYLVLRLVGTASSRDAIGATVTARAGERTWVAQLTAGDGYLVNNQRQLLFGTGPATRIDQLSISWPSGLKQDLGPVQTDQTLKIIEGRGAVVVDKKN
jgi:tetratricopeptide (TPR) repeat protein